MHSDQSQLPGAIEWVLTNARGGDHNPYDWLARAVSASAELILDVACGAGAMVEKLERPGRVVIGLDRSENELAAAADRGRRPLVRADAFYLPFADNSFDAVVTSIGLGVFPDRQRFIGEAARVLRPGGVFAALMPSLRPAGLTDLKIITRLVSHLRTVPHVPGLTEFKAKAALVEAGLTKTEDARARYYYPVHDVDSARRLFAGLRLTGQPQHAASAEQFLFECLRNGPVEIPLPMRRIIAIK